MNPIAIIVAGVLVAAAIALTNHGEIIHYEIVGTPVGSAAMVRFDRWTGSLEVCVIDLETIAGGSMMAGAKLACHTK